MPKPRGRRHARNNDPYAGIRRNTRIRVPKIRVVGPDGHQYGIMDTREALSIAQEAGLDLVEVAGQAKPPVCRIMDFGKYVYEQQKKTKDNKGSSSKTKEVKFRPRVETHDYETKLRRAEEFLDKGNKVKLSLFFRGREMAYKELGFETINRAIKDLETMGHLDNQPKLVGRNINAMISPLPANKRKPKYYVRKDQSEESETPDDADFEDEEEGEEDES
ncbi:translation initiation factor IF-3 [Puniceicoccaceae bacterium K14]|nr:translation initiation factor IF-3 [Puniceicoccaceae bacterium K14]